MKTQKSQQEQQQQHQEQHEKKRSVDVTSCRKMKNEEATFLQDMKDHFQEFIHSSIDDHKNCFNKKMQKMFGTFKIFSGKSSAEGNAKEGNSSLPLRSA